MSKKILTIVSGAPSGALNIAMTIAQHFGEFYDSLVLLRKYNKANIKEAVVVKDRFVLDYICKLYQQLKKIKPDVIIVHGYSTHLWTKVAAAIQQIPLIHVEHNVEKYTMFRRWLLQRLDRYTWAYICVSKAVAKHLIVQGIDSKKVHVIYNGIDIAAFAKEKQPHDKFTVGMTARFSKQKDHLTLIKAIEYLVKEESLPIQLILQGDGKKRAECIEYVHSHNFTENVKFETGRFLDLAPRLDLFVLSTHYEGLPLVLCEAMASKTLTVATNVPGVDEIIEHGVDGYLVPESDYKALARQIAHCYSQQKTKVSTLIVGTASRKVTEKYSVEMMCKQYQYFAEKMSYEVNE